MHKKCENIFVRECLKNKAIIECCIACYVQASKLSGNLSHHSNRKKEVKMEERNYAYINASMFDNLPKTRPYRDSNNSESSLVTLDSRNPLYQMGCSRPTSKDLYCTIQERELQQLKHYTKARLQLRKRAKKKDPCSSRVVLFLVMLIALTSFIMVLLILLRKVGPDCLCTTGDFIEPIRCCFMYMFTF